MRCHVHRCLSRKTTHTFAQLATGRFPSRTQRIIKADKLDFFEFLYLVLRLSSSSSNMGGGGSKQPQATKNTQANSNRIIDQSRDSNALFQFNWASFGGGASSVLIILGLLIVLLVCYRKNKRASHRARSSELRELVILAGRNNRQHEDSPRREPPPPYPGYPASMPAVCAPGMPGSSTTGCPHVAGLSTLGLNSALLGLGLQQPAITGPGLQQLAALAAPAQPQADWGRIREILPGPRQRVSYASDHPESILRGSRRSVGSGLSRSGSLHSLHESAVPPAAPAAPNPVSPALQSVIDRLEAEQNAASQLQ